MYIMFSNKKKQFHRFLKEKGCFSIWMKNVRNTKKVAFYESCKDYNDYLNKVNVGDAIMECFLFDSTDEGFFFWSDLSDTWVRYVERNKL